MDALQIKIAHWQQKSWKIPNTSWNISGYSRSAYRTGFYIPELDLLLDAGPQNFNKPEFILITHTHIDHISDLPKTLIGAGDSDGPEKKKCIMIYGPIEAEKLIVNYITAMFSVNAMVFIPFASIDWYKYNGQSAGDHFRITMNKTNLGVEVFKCDHAIPTISYGISEFKQKLKQEYQQFTGRDLAAIRQSGVEITEEICQKKMAYVCDTSIAVFDLNPSILEYSTVFIECTFLYPDEYENAKATQHIHWNDLKKYVIENPKIYFMLFHFSQRYRDLEIDTFFKAECQHHQISNMDWWISDQSDHQRQCEQLTVSVSPHKDRKRERSDCCGAGGVVESMEPLI